VLSRIAPNLGVLQLDLTAISRDPDVVRDYRTDPLNYTGKVRARTGTEILQTVLAMQPRLEALKLPLLLIHGSADRLVPVTTTEFVQQHAGSDDVTVKIYEGGYHESHNEPNKDAVLTDIVTWLDAHA
jgi:alpha-beta hydrolase superfamily lysophospholipase